MEGLLSPAKRVRMKILDGRSSLVRLEPETPARPGIAGLHAGIHECQRDSLCQCFSVQSLPPCA